MATLDIFQPRGHGSPQRNGGRPLARNKQWVAPTVDATSRSAVEGERWERGGHHGRTRGRGRGRGHFPNITLRNTHVSPTRTPQPAPNIETPPSSLPEITEPALESQEEQEQFYKELLAARERERIQAMAEGKMDNPDVRKRLEDAITIVGTCPDMCPRFERYRRQRENDLDRLERIPGTKRVDHQRAVKKYERAVGDKSIPSDLRPMPVLQRTLLYLFHDLLQREGMEKAHAFIRDRTRAVRSDIVIQHLVNAETLECFDSCVRFHILAMHTLRNTEGFSVAMEEQMIMNVTQSLKEYYLDLRNKFQSDTELEMRLYHRLVHLRNDKERPDHIPDHIRNHPIFTSATQFRLRVQKASTVSIKASPLKLSGEALESLAKLSEALQNEGKRVIIFLVACILERHFPDDIPKLATAFRPMQDMTALRAGLSDADIIDGRDDPSKPLQNFDAVDEEMEFLGEDELDDYLSEAEPAPAQFPAIPPAQTQTSVFSSAFAQPPQVPVPNVFQTAPVPQATAFGSLVSQPNVFGTTFGAPVASSSKPVSVFGTSSVFGAPAPVSNQLPPSKPAPNHVTPAYAPPPAKSIFSQAPAVSTTPPGPPANGRSIFSKQPSSLNPHASSFAPSSSFLPTSQPTPPPATSQPSEKQEKDLPQTTLPFSLTPSAAAAPAISRVGNLSNASTSSRVSATPPLRIDIPTATPPAATNLATEPADSFPSEPPQLPRMPPVSLPSTPSFTAPPPTSGLGRLGYLKGNRGATPATPFGPNTNTGPLSPLFSQTPTASSSFASLGSFFPTSTSSPKPSLVAESSVPGLGLDLGGGSSRDKGKTPERQASFSLPPPREPPAQPQPEVVTQPSSPVGPPPPPPKPLPSKPELRQKALAFAQRSSIVKSAFAQWLKKAVDKAAYHEACRQSDAYREKMRMQRSLNGTPDKKRRISVSLSSSQSSVMDSPIRKRPRKRPSAIPQARIPDEELAKQFKENQENRDRRWAPGTYLKTFQQLVESETSLEKMPSAWQILVSTNPESDATAIWLEKKFDIPSSGTWQSETVYAIPIPKSNWDQAHPGVIVFECTPNEGVHDDIERKYRILDDCARLREIVKSIPSQRYYNPSLLIICWTRDPANYKAQDFFDMVKNFIEEDKVLKSAAMLPLNSQDSDPDAKLAAVLDTLSLDVKGERVDLLTARDVCMNFMPSVTSFISEWVLSCTNRNRFNWRLYNSVVSVSIIVLNELLLRMVGLCKIPEDVLVPIPELEDEVFEDSDSAYDVLEEWLSDFPYDVKHILTDLQSHRDIEQEFPAQIFLDHLVQLSRELFEQAASQPAYWILHEDQSASLTESEESLQPWRIKLSQRLNVTSRRSPKRRKDTSMDVSELSGFVSPESKRARLSTPSINADFSPYSSPLPNGDTTASPTHSSVSLSQSDQTEQAPVRPVVTAAMLRALTKDLKKKYMHKA